MTDRTRSGIACLLVGFAALACASKQKIALDCVPEGITLYVDGEAYGEVPRDLELRRDRHHTLFFKGEGYRPEMVVLRSEESEGELWLSPAEVCVRPVLVKMERKLEVEVERPEGGSGGVAAEE